MALKTGDEYLKSVEDLKLEAHMMGRKSGDLGEHGLVKPSQKAVAFTYDAAHDPATRELFCVESSLCKQEINRFTHLHQSTDDLVNKVKMQRYCGISTACCFQRCVGLDAANAIFSTTYDCDQAHGTDYHQRFKDYWAWVQTNDLVVDGAMTDPKGDRGKRPKDQVDPDLFLRVKERREGGIVISGAKLHQTGMLNSHEILVMPTLTMRPGEEAWAVCCAVPTNEKGVRYIYGRQASDTRKLEADPLDVGNSFGGQEVMTVFEDVFVPNERVFLDGEVDFSGTLVERFASYHRQSYGGCKVGVGDALIGATALIAQMNGVAKASHIREKIVDMIHLNETIFSCGIACSAMGAATASGNYLVNLLLANVCKLNVTRFPYELARLATDVAGGLLGTMPSAADLNDPVTGPYIKKYLAANPDYPVLDRMKVLRLIENLVVGAGAVGYLVESMHGAGPPTAQRIMIGRQANLEQKVDRVKNMLNIA
ncbi:MAG: 4-hydroxybutyryl-CoA dehydratase [Desulfarculaceae bacterium]|nr:4-hydroxybutyryl-CoA dehydratase [Desulfarculaceae bacterium]MCF8046066.1 4-hydroxybutyryl-CoA dehydratase [Desulfarculaceae bacterium]MCF8064161.1 4-hydroxybutyryl-CoA dehydratase [Desulfarculaceae bacterium]MCF8098517.1 4-hydroxybutyryl-CoA dehydratase [Desulfarculaceae bacterium]MCF8121238.1 4-hydroxybutyryl-CoA dehydratase [Desulfarculaceae bacterium]